MFLDAEWRVFQCVLSQETTAFKHYHHQQLMLYYEYYITVQFDTAVSDLRMADPQSSERCQIVPEP